jgi:hypothetical protein
MSLPLTRSGPWTEFPATEGMVPLFDDFLFPVRAPRGARPVQVTVTVPDGCGRRPVMDIVTRQDRAVEDFATVFGYAQDAGDFEITVRRFRD